MKVLHITYSDTGGAGTAALRLHRALLDLGVESKMLVLEKKTANEHVYSFPRNKLWGFCARVTNKFGFPVTVEQINNKVLKAHTGDYEFFSFAESSFKNLVNHTLVKEADIVQLHWVANFIDYPSFFRDLGKPIVWTQHDMNAFLGGFHYRGDYLRSSSALSKVDKRQYEIKLKALSLIPSGRVTIVSPSAWMMKEAAGSEILGRFTHHHIPNGIDPKTFNLKDPPLAKKRFEFCSDKRSVLFVAERIENVRKGFSHIYDLILDPEIQKECEFIAVGEIRPIREVKGIRYMGSITCEKEISEIYSAADIYLLASNEDNLPNVMLESLAAGTPIVAFNIGGIKELVKSGDNGFLSDDISSAGLSSALWLCINHLHRFDRSKISKNLIQQYSTASQATSYLKIYREKLTQGAEPDQELTGGKNLLTCRT